MKSTASQHQEQPIDEQFSWRDTFQVHEEADWYPLLEGDELEELAQNIRERGLREPCAVHRDPGGVRWLLDGRNRLRAMELAEIPIKPEHFRELPADTDPSAYIESANVHRRHLTQAQKRRVIVKLLKKNPDWSNRRAARIANVDHKTVAAVRDEAERTGEIPQSERTVGVDQKDRPAKRTRAASGPTNIRVSLGQFGDGLKRVQKRLQTWLERELPDGEVQADTREQAHRYAEALETQAGLLRKVASGEIPDKQAIRDLDPARFFTAGVKR